MLDNLIVSCNVVLPLFLFMALGWVLTRLGLTNQSFNKTANRLCFNVALPCSIFNGICSAGLKEALKGRLVLWCILLFLTVTAISLPIILILCRDPKKRGVLLQCAVRSNYVYIGVPVCENLFGTAGSAVASAMIPLVVILFNAGAVIILSSFSEKGEKVSVFKLIQNIFKNPLILAALLAVIFDLSGLSMPKVFSSAVGSMAKLATPLVLLALGGGFEFKALGKSLGYAALGTFMRNILTPLIALSLAIGLGGFRGPELACLFMVFGAPVAVSSYPMAEAMGCDGELAGQLVVTTTTLSLVTMMAGIFIMKCFGWM